MLMDMVFLLIGIVNIDVERSQAVVGMLTACLVLAWYEVCHHAYMRLCSSKYSTYAN